MPLFNHCKLSRKHARDKVMALLALHPHLKGWHHLRINGVMGLQQRIYQKSHQGNIALQLQT